jgi:hypothetical protein
MHIPFAACVQLLGHVPPQCAQRFHVRDGCAIEVLNEVAGHGFLTPDGVFDHVSEVYFGIAQQAVGEHRFLGWNDDDDELCPRVPGGDVHPAEQLEGDAHALPHLGAAGIDAIADAARAKGFLDPRLTINQRRGEGIAPARRLSYLDGSLDSAEQRPMDHNLIHDAVP